MTLSSNTSARSAPDMINIGMVVTTALIAMSEFLPDIDACCSRVPLSDTSTAV
jgi:hypothetical protein